MKDLIIYAAPVITFGLGYLFGRDKADNWRIDAEKWKKASQMWRLAAEHWERRYWDKRPDAVYASDAQARVKRIKDMADSQTRAQRIKDMADSQSRLADALAAKNERLERIIAKGRESKSGSAQHLAKIAAGEA